ncbi:MAG: hypothetical protein ACI9FJ_002057 [Alteromonadaceae bacterium]|jgi:hypothetical protein
MRHQSEAHAQFKPVNTIIFRTGNRSVVMRQSSSKVKGVLMRVCGVELKGSDAIICLLELNEGLFSLPDCRVPRIVIKDAADGDQLRHFQFTFTKLVADYKVDQVVIRERHMRGKFAGGAAGFKLEATLQVTPELDVRLISSSEIKEILKTTELMIEFSQTGLKKFQEDAFTTAFAYLSKR